MTLTDAGPPRGPVWPLPFRLSLDRSGRRAGDAVARAAGQPAGGGGHGRADRGVRRRRGRAPVLPARSRWSLSWGVGLPPLVVDAYPTTYKRPLLTYHAARSSSDDDLREHCAAATAPRAPRAPPPICRLPPTSRRHAGEIFWLVSHGIRNAACGLRQAVSAKPGAGRDQFHQGARRADGARRSDARWSSTAPWLAAPGLTGRRRSPGRRRLRDTEAADGPAGALHRLRAPARE